MYKLVASYKGGNHEYLDTAHSLEYAKYLKEQYLLAFGKDWSVVFYNIED
tara:strand:+ start:642 stop:791 length:150 start_codon:yes stop_codon:yes gene_type:complete